MSGFSVRDADKLPAAIHVTFFLVDTFVIRDFYEYFYVYFVGSVIGHD